MKAYPVITSLRYLCLLSLFLLLGCSNPPSKEDYKLNDGVYESVAGYSIHLDGETYKLCVTSNCQSGELYRGRHGTSIYLMDFRHKIPNSDTRFPTLINFMNAKRPHPQGGNKESNDTLSGDDVYLYRPSKPLRKQNYPNVAGSSCVKHHCLTIGGSGSVVQYLFVSVKKRKPRAPIIHAPQQCRCAKMDPDFEGIEALLSKYGSENDLGFWSSPDERKAGIDYPGSKHGLWYWEGRDYAVLSSQRGEANKGKNYEDELFNLIKTNTVLRSCESFRVCTIQTNG